MCFNKKAVNRLQTVQNAAARLITGSKKRDHITPILYSLHWLPVNFRIHFKILVLVFRALHEQAPSYITELLRPYSPIRSLRSSDQKLLMVPRTRFKTRGDCSFQACAPRLWNALPSTLHSIESTEGFKKELKTYLFTQAFNWCRRCGASVKFFPEFALLCIFSVFSVLCISFSSLYCILLHSILVVKHFVIVSMKSAI